MTTAGLREVSVRIKMPDKLHQQWKEFTNSRGYCVNAFLRVFIEAVTDPVRGPEIERLVQNRKKE